MIERRHNAKSTFLLPCRTTNTWTDGSTVRKSITYIYTVWRNLASECLSRKGTVRTKELRYPHYEKESGLQSPIRPILCQCHSFPIASSLSDVRVLRTTDTCGSEKGKPIFHNLWTSSIGKIPILSITGSLPSVLSVLVKAFTVDSQLFDRPFFYLFFFNRSTSIHIPVFMPPTTDWHHDDDGDEQ